jgi:hypothetical protein
MRTYIFSVEGLPPKKDGALSMWGKPLEANRLVALRLAALETMKGAPPLSNNINLSLKLYIPINNRGVGDLDTFVTGICDGLMATHYGGKLDPIWDKPEIVDIHPKKTIAVEDDSEIIKIQAEKIVGKYNHFWYEIHLEGE